MYAKTAIAGALLAAAPIVSAGSATVSNQCSFPVYLWTVSNYQGPMKTLNAGEEYTEGYITNPDGGGVSMKISKDSSQTGGITQFEYTLTDTLWYDISNINGWPFESQGLSLIPSVSSCRSVLCAAGVELCSQAYNQPDDNEATAMCSSDSDMTLVLCSGQDNENTPSPLALSVHNGKNHSHKHHHKQHKGANVDVAASAPAAPAPAAPAAVTTAVPVGDSGVMTTFVTNIVTVTARNAEPSVAAEEPVRRHMHQHHHHHHA